MLVRLFVLILRVYRWTLSPLIGPVCRFHPSCSRYAEGCLLTHGVWRGSLLTLKRLAKCHPFHPGGHDPVPPADPRPQTDLDRHPDDVPRVSLALAANSQAGRY